MMLEQIGGAALMALFLAEIFLTILSARPGTGLLAPRWEPAGLDNRRPGWSHMRSTAADGTRFSAASARRWDTRSGDRRPTRYITGPRLTKPSCH